LKTRREKVGFKMSDRSTKGKMITSPNKDPLISATGSHPKSEPGTDVAFLPHRGRSGRSMMDLSTSSEIPEVPQRTKRINTMRRQL
jgi:hypothetical protein